MQVMRAFAILCWIAVISPFAPQAAQAELLLAIEDQSTGKVAEFDESDLLALPQIAFETSTIWTEGIREFSGPTLLSVLQAAGFSGGQVTLVAINDYSVTIPAEGFDDEAPIVALRKNGAPFGVRDKGPLWVVYPYDSDTEFQSEAIYAYSVWQLNRIKVAGGN